MKNFFPDYRKKLIQTLSDDILISIENLAILLFNTYENKKNFYICGNGGSAGNANHLANDFLYGVASSSSKIGLNIESLSANSSVITCLANDVGYEHIYSEQVKVKGKEGDLLIVLSGSGNSKNVINALLEGNKIGMNTVAILGYDGGICKNIAQEVIHCEVADMQVSEDMQLIIMHMCMQWLSQKII